MTVVTVPSPSAAVVASCAWTRRPSERWYQATARSRSFTVRSTAPRVRVAGRVVASMRIASRGGSPFRMANPRGHMDIDRLAAPLAVVLLDGAAFGSAVERGARSPHRHDYHELLWARAGTGSHLIDGERSTVRPLTVTVIGRGQVHVFEEARELSGAVVRFGGEMLFEASPAWLVGGGGGLAVDGPAGGGGGVGG